MQKQSLSPTYACYYFSRVKDIHTENGQTFITLFARLTIEMPEQSECVWVDMEEIIWNQANRKLQTAPNGIHTYEISEEVFKELERLSRHRQNPLYSLTPFYQTVKFRQLASNSSALA